MTKEKKKRKKKTRLRPPVFFLLFFLFLGFMIFSGYQLLKWNNDNKNIGKLEEKIKKEIKPKEIKEEGELVNPPEEEEKVSDYWYYVGLPFYEVDFNDLISRNQDTVAFIHMDNSNINYPVVQTNNNTYYLTHAFDKSKNGAGWVFMDYRNNINQLSDNTVIYGHGRLDKTVFGSLKNALTKSWQSQKDNYVIWLSTPKENLLFQIFSIYTIQSESYYITTNFQTDEAKEKWLSTMKERNKAPINTPVSTKDAILTLSTCQNNDGGRIVVQAKLIKKQAR